PHTTLSPSAVPQTMLSPQSPPPHSVPQTMLSPEVISVFAEPHTVVVGQALAAGLMFPPRRRCEPQMIWRLQVWPTASLLLLFAVAKKRASCTAPYASRKPAPSRSALYPGRRSAVYWRIAFTRFGVRFGFACIISATVPLTTGAAML